MSLKPRDEIYITLPSNVICPGSETNTPADYETILPTPLALNGDWEVALLECHFFHEWNNFNECELGFVYLPAVGDVKTRLVTASLIPSTDLAFKDTIQRLPEKPPGGVVSLAHVIRAIANTDNQYHTHSARTILEAGFYRTAAAVCDVICKEINERMSAHNPRVWYEIIKDRVRFYSENGEMWFVTTSPYLYQQLGLRYEEHERFGVKCYTCMPGKLGVTRPGLEVFYTLFVYSDIIDYQIVGNTKAMLLGVFPVKGARGEQQSWQFNPLQYITVPKNAIDTIRIQLCTPKGEPVPFTCGDSLARLHFRRKLV